MVSAVGGPVETDHSKAGRDIWDEGIKFYDTAVLIVLLEHRHPEFCNAGFTVLHGLMDPLVASTGIQTGAGKPDDYLGIGYAALHSFVLSSFPGEEKLKDERNRKEWNPIFNHAVEVTHRRQRD